MSAVSALSPAQRADIIARHRDGRPDITVMTGEERRQRGLMDLQQAAEHVRLATITSLRMADRVRGMDPDGISFWVRALPPAWDDEGYAAAYLVWWAAGHEAKGCYGWSRDFFSTEVMCACGERIRLPETAATG